MAAFLQQPLEALSVADGDGNDEYIDLDGETATCRACELTFVAKNSKVIKQHVKSKPHKTAVKAAVKAGKADKFKASSSAPAKADDADDDQADADEADGGKFKADKFKADKGKADKGKGGKGKGGKGSAADKAERNKRSEELMLLEMQMEAVGADHRLTGSNPFPEAMLCSRAKGGKLRPILAPPFVLRPKPQDLGKTPFLTLQSGSLPQVPSSMAEALDLFCHPGAARYPNVDVGGENLAITSWSHANKVLTSAESEGKSCWASFVADIDHPSWWPRTRHVPTYDNVIVGRGASCIGMHVDVDNFTGTRTPVSTYLTAVEGRKRVVLMPPGSSLFPIDTKEPFPVDPSPELMAKIQAAGGFYFDLMPSSGSDDSDDDEEGGRGGDADGRVQGEAVTMFVPAGWRHWLLGDSDWHCMISGSRACC